MSELKNKRILDFYCVICHKDFRTIPDLLEHQQKSRKCKSELENTPFAKEANK